MEFRCKSYKAQYKDMNKIVGEKKKAKTLKDCGNESL